MMKKELPLFDSYPAWIVAVSVGLSLSIYALGVAIVAGTGVVDPHPVSSVPGLARGEAARERLRPLRLLRSGLLLRQGSRRLLVLQARRPLEVRQPGAQLDLLASGHARRADPPRGWACSSPFRTLRLDTFVGHGRTGRPGLPRQRVRARQTGLLPLPPARARLPGGEAVSEARRDRGPTARPAGDRLTATGFGGHCRCPRGQARPGAPARPRPRYAAPAPSVDRAGSRGLSLLP